MSERFQLFKIKSHEGFFQQLPCPLISKLCCLKCIEVGLVIIFQCCVNQSRKVLISNKMVEKFGISRKAKTRALKTLQAAKIISIKRKRGCAPRVTWLYS